MFSNLQCIEDYFANFTRIFLFFDVSDIRKCRFFIFYSINCKVIPRLYYQH